MDGTGLIEKVLAGVTVFGISQLLLPYIALGRQYMAELRAMLQWWRERHGGDR